MRKVAETVDDWLEGSPRLSLALILGLLAGVAFVHRAFSHEFNFDFFYLLPVTAAARYGGRRLAVLVCLVAAAEWFADDYWWSYDHTRLMDVPLGPLGYSAANALLCLAIFLGVAVLVSRLESIVVRERRVSRVKSEMISLVSHEFNNALTSMGMATTLLEERRGEPIDGEMLELLHRNLNALKRVVENFLNEARLESGHFALDVRDVDAATILAGVVETLESLARQKEVALARALPRGALVVKADPDALSLVLTNLVSNAVKYTPSGGSVTVGLSAEAGRALFRVADSGIGMSAAELKRALAGERSAKAKRSSRGYGLGLKLASEMLLSHGSRLDVDTAPGKGSKFSFRLPLA